MSSQSSPKAFIDGVPPDVAAIPGVIRTAAANHSPALARGYSPKLSMDMASAHRWAPYEATISALRDLALTPLTSSCTREQARDTVERLYGREPPPPFGLYGGGQSAAPAPFAAARRFPAGKVYVCLDRAPFAQRMQGILEPLARAEAAADHVEELVSACSGFVRGIGDALDELTRVDDDAAAVLFDRAVFESAFLLTWTEPEKTKKAAKEKR